SRVSRPAGAHGGAGGIVADALHAGERRRRAVGLADAVAIVVLKARCARVAQRAAVAGVTDAAGDAGGVVARAYHAGESGEGAFGFARTVSIVVLIAIGTHVAARAGVALVAGATSDAIGHLASTVFTRERIARIHGPIRTLGLFVSACREKQQGECREPYRAIHGERPPTKEGESPVVRHGALLGWRFLG